MLLPRIDAHPPMTPPDGLARRGSARSRGLARVIATTAAHAAALPIRALARERTPAIADADAEALHVGDAPPTGGKLLLLYDGGCGICLHARDTIAALDRRHRLVHDQIARHDGGLLADLAPEERYASWHVVLPDGRRLSGGEGLEAVVRELPLGKIPARIIHRFPGARDGGYLWFARNRGWISRGSGLIEHPQRDPREQLGDPRHDEVVD